MTIMLQHCSVASAHAGRLSACSILNPPNSTAADDSPVPKSTRPLEMRSSVAMRSATRAGWLYLGGICTMPWPSLICSVRWLAAAKNTSGADECEYSSKKWCSTSQA